MRKDENGSVGDLMLEKRHEEQRSITFHTWKDDVQAGRQHETRCIPDLQLSRHNV